MSRLAKNPIEIPAKTEITVDESSVIVKGPLGELKMNYKPVVEIKKEENKIILVPKNQEIETLALWGTYASIIGNLIEGVNKEYEKKLTIEGVGFRASIQGDKIVLNVGFSHPVELKIPQGIKASVEKDTISVSGIDKALVGQFAANIKAVKKPEPYKGKGIRYQGEIIRRKEGKKTA